MQYTFTLAHLKEIKCYRGQILTYGESIGVMGNTGESDGAHFHAEVVEGIHLTRWYNSHLMAQGNPKPSENQLAYFMTADFVDPYNKDGVEIIIKTPFNDPGYYKLYKRPHPAIDMVAEDRKRTTAHHTGYWNRKKFSGRVVFTGFNKWLGNHVCIGYDTLDYLKVEPSKCDPVLNNDIGAEYLGPEGTLYSMVKKHSLEYSYGQIEDLRYIKVRPENIGIVVGNARIMELTSPGINGTFFWPDDKGDPYPTSILKIKNQIFRSRSNHYPAPQSVLCYYTDGTLGIEIVSDIMDIERPTHWCIGGLGLKDKESEGFTGKFSDVWRRTNHTSIGFDADCNIFLVRSWDCERLETVEHMKKLNCIGYVGLDSGGSNQIKTPDWQRPTKETNCRKVNTLIVATV